MKRHPVVPIVAALVLAAPLVVLRADEAMRVASVPDSPRSRMVQYPGELIVQFRDGVPDRESGLAIRDAGGARARRSTWSNRYLVTMADGLSVESGIRRLSLMPEVEYVEPNGVMRAFARPNDSFLRYQWHLSALGAERMWDIQTGDPSVVVAVLDSGIAYEDFGAFRKAPDWGDARFVTGFNVFTRDEHANDDNFHGTHVASVIAEGTDNQIGAAGFAYRCGLMPVKVLDAEGVGSFFGVAEGIDYAVNFRDASGSNPVKVINLSLGGEERSNTVASAVSRALGAGILVVAAAGNEDGPVAYPAAESNVVAVGALDGRKQRAFYSNHGPELDVVAYGGDLDRDDNNDGEPDGILQQTFDPFTAFSEGRYDDFALFFVVGTSQATPQVSALAALLYRQGITDPRAVRAAIESTAEDLGAPGRDDDFGHGLIQPARALTGLGLNH